ncbi:MAG TPA: flagellin [Tepidisphaeraceae bacterium]|nr:flagellin [Tepidisphaeraceae bacterium]
MSRINTNVSSLIAQRVLSRNNDALNKSLQRLSTGLKINSGGDNPAGLIASENLRAEKAGILQAIDNANRATNIVGTAEGGLAEISNLLTEVQSLVSASANSGGLSQEEKNANQLQIDSILNTINRIAGSTSFQGSKLLNGNYDYTTSGVASTALTDVRINAARVPDGATTNVVVNVTTSAQTGVVSFSGSTAGAVTIEITGNLGTQQLSFASGTTASSIATAIAGVASVTGVSAVLSGGAAAITSTEFGSEQFVSVRALSGTFSVTGGTNGKDFGRDAVVNVNGASAQAQGKTISYRSGGLDVEFDLADAFNVGSSSTSFAVTGGGATFALGSKASEAEKTSLGIRALTTGNLGSSSKGFLSSLASGGANALTGTTLSTSQAIVDSAIKQVSELRGRLGAFQKYELGSTVNSLGIALENASAAESAIRDTDFAEETANLTRNQILSQAASSVLSQANASPQAALLLLR